MVSLQCVGTAIDCLEEGITAGEANGYNIAAGMSRLKLLRLREDLLAESLLILSNKDLCQMHILKMCMFSLGSVVHEVFIVLLYVVVCQGSGLWKTCSSTTFSWAPVIQTALAGL